MQLSHDYRPDIDGLRAVAILSVVFYHFAIWPIRSGFVGVDVFFVISGFLITSLMSEQIKNGSFSLLSFYERRARRIMPALIAVVSLSLIAGWWLLLPADLATLGWQSASAVIGVSNFYFWQNTGYFDPAADIQPLLHTWSLAVEEQFYLVWPISLVWLSRLGVRSKRLLGAVVGFLVIGSLAISEWSVLKDQTTAFFMLPSRAWELGIGSLLAFAPIMHRRELSELSGATGLLLLVFSIVLIEPNGAFPGLAAVTPCLGTALIIWPKRHATLAAKMLSLRPVVFFGLISYSLYLWHWPLLVYWRTYDNSKMPSDLEAVILICISIALATASWLCLEAPFRKTGIISRKGAMVAGATATSLLIVAGSSIAALGGIPSRFPKEARAILGPLSGTTEHFCSVSLNNAAHELVANGCDGQPSQGGVLIFGDSHADHFVAAINKLFPDVPLTVASTSGCRPVLEPKANDIKKKSCEDFFKTVLFNLIPNRHFDSVILSARWRNGDADQISGTVRYIRKHSPHVIVFGQTLEYSAALPDILLNPILIRKRRRLEDFRRYDASKKVDNFVRMEAAASGASFYSPIDRICPGGEKTCIAKTPNGTPIARDYGHFSDEGAYFIVQGFTKMGLNLR